ncbi:MAG: copper-translocating P-type ATPase [Clostridia bacterium]|nr:copper-translocating P-type ATPase [Clostridia bacterium]
MKKIRYSVLGMGCAVCVGHVERTINKICGEGSVVVSLLTSSAIVTVADDTDEDALFTELKKALKGAGYTLKRSRPENDGGVSAGKEDYKKSLRTLIASIIITLALMYVSMGHMLSLPLPADARVLSVLQIALTLPVMILNRKFFKNGISALIRRAPNMDSLISLGSAASFIYGIFATVMIFIASAKGDAHTLHTYAHNLYFESAAMILTLVSLGKTLESRAKDSAADAIGKLSRMLPDTVMKITEDGTLTVSVSELSVGDKIAIKAGEIIPADAVIIEGACSVDESMLTGESIPVERQVGDGISAACTLLSGYVVAKVERIGSDTAHAKIIALLEDAAASKAPIARVADKISAVFVPSVMAISVITAIVWLLLGEGELAVRYALSVLVISCPCALGLATPTAIMVGTGLGVEHGILIKSAEALEELSSLRYFMTDKTGTLTEGRPTVTDVIAIEGVSEEDLIRAAYTAEIMSSHPLANAVCSYAEDLSIKPSEAKNFRTVAGRGITADTDEGRVALGRPEFLLSEGFSDAGCDFIRSNTEKLEKEGKTAVSIALGDKTLGVLGIADSQRSDSKAAISELHGMGISAVMLTGDNGRTARAIGDACGIDEIYSELLPEDKERIIREYRESAVCAMVGDGINDAPALASANIGIAIGAGTEVAIDSADIVLSKNSLGDAVKAIKLSRATMRTIKQNLFWALIYNAICIPIAAGVLVPLGIAISPMIASAAMSVSSVCVVLNSIRLKKAKI